MEAMDSLVLPRRFYVVMPDVRRVANTRIVTASRVFEALARYYSAVCWQASISGTARINFDSDVLAE